jgi:hypothetical protein
MAVQTSRTSNARRFIRAFLGCRQGRHDLPRTMGRSRGTAYDCVDFGFDAGNSHGSNRGESINPDDHADFLVQGFPVSDVGHRQGSDCDEQASRLSAGTTPWETKPSATAVARSTGEGLENAGPQGCGPVAGCRRYVGWADGTRSARQCEHARPGRTDGHGPCWRHREPGGGGFPGTR